MMSHNLCPEWVKVIKCCSEKVNVVFAYLKLDDGVLVYVNVPGGNGVLSKLAGDKHHGWLILLPASVPHVNTEIS